MRRISMFLAMALFMVSIPLVSAQTAANSELLDPGRHHLQWTGNWYVDVGASIADVDFEGVLLQGDQMLFGVVVYGNTAFGAELRDIFVDGFGSELGAYSTVDAGSRSGVHWELGRGLDVTLYAVFIDGELGQQSLGYFVVAPSASFASTVSTIQRDFTLDGATVLRGVDGAGLQQRAQVGSSNLVTSAPPVQDSVFVYATEVGWAGPWEYDVVNSTTDQATFSQVNEASGLVRLVSYGEFFDSTSVTGAQVLETYANAFFSSIGTFDAVEMDGGFLDDGADWRMYRFTYQGTQLATFITVSQMIDGSYAVTTVTGNADSMTLTLVEVQEQFSLDRNRSLLDRVDPIYVTLTLLT